MTSAIRILFVDDHTLFRESVVRLLEQEAEFEVVAHCATLRDANQIITTTAVDVVLLDYDLGAEVGTEFVDVIQRMRTGVKILMVTGGMGSNSTLRAVNGGISGIILKHNDPHHLVAAIRRVAAGETWWDPTILHSLGAGANRGSAAVETAKALTDRQRKVLCNILDGFTNKEIATRMQASETSIKASIQELFVKAGVRTRSQLVRVAIEQHSVDWLRNE